MPRLFPSAPGALVFLTALLIALGCLPEIDTTRPPAQSAAPDIEALRNDIIKVHWTRPNHSVETATGLYVGRDPKNAFFITTLHSLYLDNRLQDSAIATAVEVQFRYSPTSFSAQVIRNNDNLDLAVLAVDAQDLPPRLIATPARDPVINLPVQIIGHPPVGGWVSWEGAVENELAANDDGRQFATNSDTSLTDGFSGAPVFDNQGHFIGMHRQSESSYGDNVKSSAIIAQLKAWQIPIGNISEIASDSRTNKDFIVRQNCSSETPEALRLALKAKLIDRVRQNLDCEPENAADGEAQHLIASMFDQTSFPDSVQFLNDVWTTRLSSAGDVCQDTHQALSTHAFDSLVWLLSKGGSPNSPHIQGCATFNDDLVQALFFTAKPDIQPVVNKLMTAGLALDYDDYALFRDAYEAYIDTELGGYEWVSDSVAPQSLAAFNEAKARADAHVISTSKLFTEARQPSQSGFFAQVYENSRLAVQKLMNDYCPESRSYCEGRTSATASPATPPPVSLRADQYVDRASGLMWVAHASDDAMNWPKAIIYCRQLQQGGFRDWRLPQPEELLKLYNSSVTVTSQCKGRDGEPITLHVNTSVDPGCGDLWSGKKSDRKLNLGGYNFDYAVYVDFANGGFREDPTAWIGSAEVYEHHALCVRNLSK